MKESELEKILIREVREEGGRAYKWISPGNDGVPDRIVFFPNGEIFFIELKADRGKVGPLQEKQIERLRSFRQQAGVVRGVAGLAEFFRGIGRGYIADRLEEKYGREVMPDEV